MATRRILVTGSTGFIGSRLVLNLLEKGESKIRCFCRQNINMEKIKILKDRFPNREIEIFQGNLANQKEAKKAVKNVEVIYNCVASKSGPIGSMFLNTVVTTKNLLEAVRTLGNIRRFIHISSFAVYGIANLEASTIISETTPLELNLKRRDDPYVFTKLKQEMLVWKYGAKYGLPLVVVRPGVIYGPGGDEISRRIGINFLGHFLNIGKNNILPLSYIDNCADAIILAGTVPGVEGEAFNIHDSELCTCNEFLTLYRKEVKRIKIIKIPYYIFLLFSSIIEKYAKHSKGQIPAVINPYKAASIWKGYRFDNTKIIEKLGWTQKISTEQGLKEHFNYCREIHSLEKK
jgi:nucleoside-diphosphate-sugar epimerase